LKSVKKRNGLDAANSCPMKSIGVSGAKRRSAVATA